MYHAEDAAGADAVHVFDVALLIAILVFGDQAINHTADDTRAVVSYIRER